MNDVAILEDGIELLAASAAELNKEHQAEVDAAARKWKQFSGREHPGKWGSYTRNNIVTGAPMFEYHDWRVVWATAGNFYDNASYFHLSRRCRECRTWRGLKELRRLSDIQPNYEALLCNEKKCKKLRKRLDNS